MPPTAPEAVDRLPDLGKFGAPSGGEGAFDDREARDCKSAKLDNISCHSMTP